MNGHTITLTDKDLVIISTICHEFKDVYRGEKEMLLPIMDFEKRIAEQTAGAYESDTTYDWVEPEPNPDAHYSVWVGGVEVNDYLVTLEEAEEIAQAWRDKGYDDVVIDDYKK